MKKSYRLAQERIYTDAITLASNGKAKPKKVTAHRDASATVWTDPKLTALIKAIPGVDILEEGKTEITFTVPAALEYHTSNPPLFTAEEKEEMERAKAERAANRKTSDKGVEWED